MVQNCLPMLLAMGATGKGWVISLLVITLAFHVGGQAIVPPVLPPTGTVLPPDALPPMEMAPAPAPSLEDLFPPCQGVLAVYTTTFTKKIYPYLNETPWIQPYSFMALASLTNMGYSTVENWEMGITYQHNEVSTRVLRSIHLYERSCECSYRVQEIAIFVTVSLNGIPPQFITCCKYQFCFFQSTVKSVEFVEFSLSVHEISLS